MLYPLVTTQALREIPQYIRVIAEWAHQIYQATLREIPQYIRVIAEVGPLVTPRGPQGDTKVY